MAGKKKPAKTPTMNYPAVHFCKTGRNPEELRALEAKNREIIAYAIGCASHTVKHYAQILKDTHFERSMYVHENGFYHIPKDAPKAGQLAEQFLNSVADLDAATNDGDVKLVREFAIEVGVMAVKVAVEATRRKSLGDVLRKHSVRISGSSKGGKVEPVWQPVAKRARELFAKYKRGNHVSDSAVIKRIMGELEREKREHKHSYTVPKFTCLWDHLVKKPSSGK